MQNFKKLIAAATTMAMVAVMGLVTFAAPNDASDNYQVASVTVSGIKEGNTLKLYKIVQFNLDDATNDFSYTLAEGLPGAYDTVEELAALTPDGYTLAGNDATIKNAADIIANGISTGTIIPIGNAVTKIAGDGDTANITNLPAGWYLAVVTGTADDSLLYQHMLINALPVADAADNSYKSADDISFGVKHSGVDITKGVGAIADHTADVDTTDTYAPGDTVPFEIHTNIPNYPTPAKNAKFVITDEPTNLTDNVETILVTVGGATVNASATTFAVAPADDGFTITFVKDYILANAGKAVTVNYDATIKENAVVDADGVVAGNSAKVTFNPNPNDAAEVEPSDRTENHLYGVNVLKYDQTDGTTHSLSGAAFTLYENDGTTVAGANTPVDANGFVSWNGLKAGTYKLVETKAPVGYRLNSNPITVTISEDAATDDNRKTTDVAESNFLQVDVANEKGSTLPSTGGAGTMMIYILGSILVLGAGVALVVRKKVQK